MSDWTTHDVGRNVLLESTTVGFADANCYILGCRESLEGAVIDPGTMDREETSVIGKRVEELGLTIRYIVNTHGHPDHMSGNDFLKAAVGGEVLIHELDGFHTPGHSAGGMALVGDGFVFTGDTLFAGSIGRSDLPCSSEENTVAYDVLLNSIRERLFDLPDDTLVLAGHGPTTTIGEERTTNPFVR